MERIKEAIRLAKSRQGAANPVVEQAPINPPQPGHAPRAEKFQPPKPAPVSMVHVNRHHLEANRIVAHVPGNQVAASFDFLRTKLIQEMEQEGWRIIGITSPTPGCGKTFTAINLALSMSRIPDCSVVLVDLDMRKPSVAEDLGLRLNKDLSTYIRGEANIAESTVQVDVAGPRLRIIANHSPVPRASEVIISGQIRDMIDRLKAEPGKPYVIVDLPPILSADDVIAFLPYTDCCILTVAEGESTAKDIDASERLLAASNYLGCVLNKSNEPMHSYY